MFAEQSDSIGDPLLFDRVTASALSGMPASEVEYYVERRDVLEAGAAFVALVRLLCLVQSRRALKGQSCCVSSVSQCLPNGWVSVLEDHCRTCRRLQDAGTLDERLRHDLRVLVNALASSRGSARSVHNGFRSRRRHLVQPGLRNRVAVGVENVGAERWVCKNVIHARVRDFAKECRRTCISADAVVTEGLS